MKKFSVSPVIAACLLMLVASGCVSVKTRPFYDALLSGNTESDRILIFEDTEIISDSRRKRARRSLSYKIAEKFVISSGLKKRWNYSVVKLEKYLLSTDQRKRAMPPKPVYKNINIEKITIDGFSCYFLSPKGTPNTSKAIFYLHGGGLVYEMHPIHWMFAESIVRNTSMPMCIPMYPLFPVIDPEIIMQFIIDSYMEFSARYPDSEIIDLGDSAGANLTLSFRHYIMKNNLDLRRPKKSIVVSPAMVIGNDESVIEEMNRIEPYDVMLSVNMLNILPKIFRFSEEDLNWWTAPLYGDFSEFPPIYLFSGTWDIFYPQMTSFVERLRSQDKQVVFITGHEMMHDWPVVPIVPECEKAFNKIVGIILEE